MDRDLQELIRDTCNAGARSERLLFRKLRLEDAEDMYRYTSRFENVKYLSWGPHKSIAETEAFLCQAQKRYNAGDMADILWGIVEGNEGRLIGVIRIYHIGKSAELSYILNQDYWGKGYMTEAVNTAIRICRERLGVERVYAFFSSENRSSEKVMRRCGMWESPEGNYNCIIRGKNCEIVRYMIGRGGQTAYEREGREG